MIDFFRVATFFSFQQEYWPILAKKTIMQSIFECLKVANSGFDVSLHRYYQEKAQIDLENQKIIKHHQKTTDAHNK